MFEKENDKYVIKRKKEAGVVPYEAVCTRKTILYDLNFDDGNASFTFNFIHDQLTFNGNNQPKELIVYIIDRFEDMVKDIQQQKAVVYKQT